jgi:hypothetical protein
MVNWDPDHPYRWRTWIRCRLPYFLIDLGVANKAEDCEAAGAAHHWYNIDGQSSGCYHCQVVRPGRLWERSQPSRAPAGRARKGTP